MKSVEIVVTMNTSKNCYSPKAAAASSAAGCMDDCFGSTANKSSSTFDMVAPLMAFCRTRAGTDPASPSFRTSRLAAS